MTFNDIFKSSFLESTTEFSLLDVLLAMAFACVLGAFIYFVYKKTFQGVMYSSGFGITLVGLTMVTTLVILAVTSNVVLSLGMVGALSIVRFRAAIKEPFEIVFLFWALAVGIVIGAGMFLLAVVGSLIIGVILVVFARRKIGEHPYIIVLSCTDGEAEARALEALGSAVGKYVVKAKTVTAAGIEISAEVTLNGDDTAFVTALGNLEGIASASLVTYNGQFAD
ncbi:MAG: DUF4956 domain-containing protein [Oscillospiraceae bacterium]|nr:DUF4956 domain-containing protein [Oscillospiraceae bacterium]